MDPVALNKICTHYHETLEANFPGHVWTVLPDLSLDEGRIGLFISTPDEKSKALLMCRPCVKIYLGEALYMEKLWEEVMAAFEKKLTGQNEKFREGFIKVWVISEEGSCPRETPSYPRP